MKTRQKTDKRFFDPREPGPRRRDAAEMCIRFNELHPVGTPVRVWPLARWLDDCCKETIVKAPGAFVNPAGHAVVKIPGDCIALTHVQILGVAS
jgi:hypothetical protein